MTETLLHFAARRDHLRTKVEPALAKGQWVVSDRFADSTTAYQGYGHGVDLGAIAELYRITADDLKPDLTVILDMEVEPAMARALNRGGGEDRYEKMDREFHERLRRGFLAIAQAEPDRCIVVSAAGSIEDVQARIQAAAGDRLKRIKAG